MIEPPRAELHRSWWPGWIWSVPLAALLVVAWLLIRSLTQGGPSVTVIFPEIANLRPGDTKVTFEGYDVGTVESVKLQPDLKHMRATLSLHGDMAGHLGKGTKFWIIGDNLSLSNISAIRSMITGLTVGIYPSPGGKQKRYEAQSGPPPLPYGAEGTRYTLYAPQIGSVQRGTEILFHDQKVGQVVATHMEGGSGFMIDVFVQCPNDALVRAGTRFWRAGPVQITHGGGGTAIHFQSVPALFGGAIAFDTPGGPQAGVAARPGRDFALYDSQDEAESAPDAESVEYHAVFHQATGVPKVGAPVTMLGKRVGSVTRAALQYDPKAGAMQVAVTLALDPRDIALSIGRWSDPHTQMRDMMQRLVAAGLHAALSVSPPVIGGQQIALEVTPGEPGTLGSGPVPELPVREGGGGITGITAGVNAVVAKIDAMPLDAIGRNLRDISAHLAKLTRSPALLDTIHHIDRTSASLQRVAAEARTQLPATMRDLRETVGQAQQSLGAARNLLSARGGATAAPGSADLPEALGEISRAARALRELADYLDRHPASVVLGRSGP